MKDDNEKGVQLCLIINRLFSRFCFIALLFMSPSKIQALSAVTVNTIQGNAPYLWLDGVKVADLSLLLSIKVGDERYISDEYGIMKKINTDGSIDAVDRRIVITDKNASYSHVKTWVPADGNKYSLDDKNIIAEWVYHDDDGDELFTLTGELTAEWQDKEGNNITDLNSTLSSKSSPYSLTLTTTGMPSISTQYGHPNTTIYGNSRAKYLIDVVAEPTINFATPNMNYARDHYAGDITEWDIDKGFIPQSFTPESYDKNFPTTGANNLYFKLDISGMSTSLEWPDVTVGGITATMSEATPTSVTVTLTGPSPTFEQTGYDDPGKLTTPMLPAKFEIQGKSNGVVVVKYGFELKQWFINRANVYGGPDEHAAWCNNVGYSMPRVMDLTNATGSTDNGLILPPVQVPSSGNYFQRRIGGGLFSEWGEINKYANAYFLGSNYWTTDKLDDDLFYVNPVYGRVDGFKFAALFYGICVHY